MATYVLIHGAYQGAWIWKPIVTRLRDAGQVAHALTLDGCAERAHLLRRGITVGTHAHEVAQFLFYEDLANIVLVGTSSGGMVVQKAAELARDRIGWLVFVDALALMPGERVDDIVKRATPNETTDIATGPTRADAESRLFRDLDVSTRACAAGPDHAAPGGRPRGPDGGDHLLGTVMARDGDPLPSRGESPRGAPAAHRGATQSAVA
jgi:pimeloyl-ACP methyl ester carboxylesterase